MADERKSTKEKRATTEQVKKPKRVNFSIQNSGTKEYDISYMTGRNQSNSEDGDEQ